MFRWIVRSVRVEPISFKWFITFVVFILQLRFKTVRVCMCCMSRFDGRIPVEKRKINRIRTKSEPGKLTRPLYAFANILEDKNFILTECCCVPFQRVENLQPENERAKYQNMIRNKGDWDEPKIQSRILLQDSWIKLYALRITKIEHFVVNTWIDFRTTFQLEFSGIFIRLYLI